MKPAWRVSAAVISAVLAVTLAMSSPAGATGSWTIVASPNPGVANAIGGLIALSPTNVRAIGTTSSPSYAGCHGRTLLSRWSGTRFIEVTTGSTAICASVNGVAGSSNTDLWAVGSANDGRDTHIRHWNGSAWSTVVGAPIQVPPSGGRRHRSTGLNAATALSRTDVWVVGGAQYADFSNNTLVEHWTGTSWSLVPAAAASGSILRGVAAAGPSDIWAVGSGGSVGAATLSTLIEHWDGSKWSTVPSSNADRLNYLRGVSTVGPGDVWAVGDSIKDPSDGISVSHTFIEHWNGSAWSTVPSPNIGTGNNSLAAVAAHSASDVWAVGYFDDRTGSIPVRRTLIEHWNGTSWSVMASPNAGTGDNWLSAVVAPKGSSQVFASGNSAEGTLVERLAS